LKTLSYPHNFVENRLIILQW